MHEVLQGSKSLSVLMISCSRCIAAKKLAAEGVVWVQDDNREMCLVVLHLWSTYYVYYIIIIIIIIIIFLIFSCTLGRIDPEG